MAKMYFTADLHFGHHRLVSTTFWDWRAFAPIGRAVYRPPFPSHSPAWMSRCNGSPPVVG